jgi:DNA-binding NtrC family response regulator
LLVADIASPHQVGESGMGILSIADIRELLQTLPATLEELERIVLEGGGASILKDAMRKLSTWALAITHHDRHFDNHDSCEHFPLIWITGERGVGKREAIRGMRAQCPTREYFFELDCASLPEHETRAKLFGHGDTVSGGLFSEADAGLLAIYEPQKLSVECQEFLLRWQAPGRMLLQDRDSEFDTLDPVVMLVASENAELLVQSGKVLPGLLSLSADPLHIAPLRDRPNDLAFFMEYFFRSKGKEYTGAEFSMGRNVDEEALFVLMNFHWPDNRDALYKVLASLVFSCLITNRNHVISLSDVVGSLEKRYGPEIFGKISPSFRRVLLPGQRRAGKKKISPDEIRVFRRFVEMGYQLDDIGQPLRLSRSQVSRLLSKGSRPPLRRGRPPKYTQGVAAL